MNQSSGRSAVFLEEMGVGPLWHLRAARVVDGVSSEPGLEPALELEPGLESVRVAAPAVMQVETPAPAVLARVPAAPAALAPPPLAPDFVAPAAAPVVAAPVVAAPAAASAPAPEEDASTAWFDDAPAPPPVAPVSDAAIAAMDWDELKTVLAKCTRCDLCRGRKGVVQGRGDRKGAWMIVGAGPNRADEKAAQAISGDAGTLLDNMLLAMKLAPGRDVYVTNLVKCRPSDASGAERAPTPGEVAACRPFLERELALTGSRTILTLGRAAAAGLMREPAAARGSVRRLGAVAVVATYHPEDMLRQGADKAKAWPDLCLAMNAHAEQG